MPTLTAGADFNLLGSNSVHVTYNITGLQVSTDYAWAVYEQGDLLAYDTMLSVGSLFLAPTELASLHSDQDGTVAGDYVDTQVKLSGFGSIVGRALVLNQADGTHVAWGVVAATGVLPDLSCATSLSSLVALVACVVCALLQLT